MFLNGAMSGTLFLRIFAGGPLTFGFLRVCCGSYYVDRLSESLLRNRPAWRVSNRVCLKIDVAL